MDIDRDIQELFIYNLKHYRNLIKMTQADLAEKCGVSVGFIGQIETKRALPSLFTIGRIATTLGITPNKLFAQKDQCFWEKNSEDSEQDRARRCINSIKSAIERFENSD